MEAITAMNDIPRIILVKYSICIAAATILLCLPCETFADQPQIVAACHRFLDLQDSVEPSDVAKISAYQGDISQVIESLLRSEKSDHRDESGVLANQLFTCPELKASYPEDMIHYYVPEAYSPSTPFGLIIFMHGGSRTTPREHPRHVVTHPDDDQQSIGLQPFMADQPLIIVAPSAPWDESTGARWNVPDADEYISAVIRECCYRFNVDTDRVFLGGYSMGGFGAFHLCQRLSDRLAGGFVFSGAWKTMHWKAWTGLPLFIRHGVNDAAPNGTDGIKGRPRFTDVFYARTADRRLTELGLPHVYVEDDGNHAIRPATEAMSTMKEWIRQPRRDPFARHVVAVSPRGWKSSSDTSTPHCRWITIDEIGDGEIDFDRAILNGPSPSFGESAEKFHEQSFQLDVQPVKAGLVDATLQRDNRIVVLTDNVKKFTLWLHPSMVDFSKPVHVTLNGTDSAHVVTPSLLDALRSYQRREDWRLVYHAAVPLQCGSP